MNSVVMIGNLTKDVELRSTQNGKSVATFSIAVQRAFKSEGQPEADFFNIVIWGVKGENCAKYLSKGKKVAIVGSVQNRTYDDKNGNKRTLTEIIADDVEFLTPKNNEAQNGSNAFDTPMEEVDEDIPFQGVENESISSL